MFQVLLSAVLTRIPDYAVNHESTRFYAGNPELNGVVNLPRHLHPRPPPRPPSAPLLVRQGVRERPGGGGDVGGGGEGAGVDRGEKELGEGDVRREGVSSQATASATSGTRVRMGKRTSSSMGVATGPVVTTWTAMPSRSTSLARAAAKALRPALEAE